MKGKLIEQNKYGLGEELYLGNEEGRKKIFKHHNYERSSKNRAKAIEIHGTRCSACGFDFNEYYGNELADNFIEIHHIKPLSEINEGKIVNPKNDLVPLCSNCHSMVHRNRSKVLTIDELREHINANKR